MKTTSVFFCAMLGILSYCSSVSAFVTAREGDVTVHRYHKGVDTYAHPYHRGAPNRYNNVTVNKNVHPYARGAARPYNRVNRHYLNERVR